MKNAPSGLVNKLFSRYDQEQAKKSCSWSPYAADLSTNSLVFLGGLVQSKDEPLSNALTSRFSVVELFELGSVEPYILSKGSKHHLLVVNIDKFKSCGAALDFLLTFRSAHDTIPIILATSGAQHNDFSSDRKVICDATLKLPTSHTIFALVLSAAENNNRVLPSGA